MLNILLVVTSERLTSPNFPLNKKWIESFTFHILKREMNFFLRNQLLLWTLGWDISVGKQSSALIYDVILMLLNRELNLFIVSWAMAWLPGLLTLCTNFYKLA